MDHAGIAFAIGEQVVPDEEASGLGVHIGVEGAEVRAATLLRSVQIKQKGMKPFASEVFAPVSSIEMIVELAIATVVGSLPLLEMGRGNAEALLNARLDSSQHGLQFAAEPFFVGGVTDPEGCEDIQVVAVRLLLVSETGLPVGDGQLVEDKLALSCGEEVIVDDDAVAQGSPNGPSQW